MNINDQLTNLNKENPFGLTYHLVDTVSLQLIIQI